MRKVGKKLLIKRVGLLFGSTLIFLILAEVFLRISGIGPSRWAHPWHLERDDKRVGLDVYPDNPRDYFEIDLRDSDVMDGWRNRGVPDLDRAAQHTPFAVAFEYNEQLCRHSELGPKDPSKTRVLFIGDSFTEGQGVRGDHTFAALLNESFGADVEVINCGRRGHDFPMIREFFNRRLDLEPDIVVYTMILNDPVQSEAFHDRQQYLDDWILDRRRMYTNGNLQSPSFWQPRLWVFLSDHMEGLRVGRETMRWYVEMYGEANAQGWQQTQDHIAAMNQAMKTRDGDFLVLLLPLFVRLEGDYPFGDVSAIISEAMEAQNIAFFDTTPTFLGTRSSELWVHPADRHPNERAHRMIAEAIEPTLRSLIDGQ